MRTRSLILAAPLLFGCSLHRQPAGPEPARGPARDSLFELDQTRGDSVAVRGLVEGVLALLSPDIVYLRAGAPMTYGREAVHSLLLSTAERATAPAAGRLGQPGSGSPASWQPLGGGVSDDLRSAYTFGIAAHLGQPKSAGPIRLERYIAFWQRTATQAWRIVAYAEVGSVAAGTPTISRADDTSTASEPPPSPPTARAHRLVRSAAEAAELARAADSSFADLAYRMGLAFAFENTAEPDAVVFGGPQLVIGPKAIGEFYDTERAGTSITWHPVYGSAAASGDLAFTVGESIITGRGSSGAAVQRFGKYLTVWKRQKDGRWRFVIDGGNLTR